MKCIVYIDRYNNHIYIQEVGKNFRYYMSHKDFDFNVKNNYIKVIQKIYI